MTTNLWGDEPRSYRLAAGVYAVRDGKVAFLQRGGGVMVGFWSIPGGIVDPGEDPRTAALRELHEESGLIPTGPVEYLDVFPMQAYGSDILRFHYVARCDDGEIVLSHEHTDGAWLTPREYLETHVNEAEFERWNAASPQDGFNVLANRAAIEALIAHLEAAGRISQLPR